MVAFAHAFEANIFLYKVEISSTRQPEFDLLQGHCMEIMERNDAIYNIITSNDLLDDKCIALGNYVSSVAYGFSKRYLEALTTPCATEAEIVESKKAFANLLQYDIQALPTAYHEILLEKIQSLVARIIQQSCEEENDTQKKND